MSDDKPDLILLRKACSTLIEHFDTVQIFVTRHEPTENHGTVNIHIGRGNWFARYGHIKEWILLEEETARMKAHRDDENCED
jgi:hypothetical protein